MAENSKYKIFFFYVNNMLSKLQCKKSKEQTKYTGLYLLDKWIEYESDH